MLKLKKKKKKTEDTSGDGGGKTSDNGGGQKMSLFGVEGNRKKEGTHAFFEHVQHTGFKN